MSLTRYTLLSFFAPKAPMRTARGAGFLTLAMLAAALRLCAGGPVWGETGPATFFENKAAGAKASVRMPVPGPLFEKNLGRKTAAAPPGQAGDLSLAKTLLSSPVASVGDTAIFRVVVYNDSTIATEGVSVLDEIPAGTSFAGATATQGSYDHTTGIWTIGTMPVSPAPDSVILVLKVKILEAGVIFNIAQIQTSEPDKDSTPGNSDPLEDDIASACVSVPIGISSCTFDTVYLTAPSGHSNYQWYLDGNPISGANGAVYKAAAAGSYTFTTDLNPTGCAGGNCCPVIIEQRLCLGNRVWADIDNDGFKDPFETGIDGVTVEVYSDADGDKNTTGDQSLVASTTTAGGGFYQFSGLEPGNYFVKLTGAGIPAGLISSTGGGIYDSSGSGSSEPASDPDNNIDTDDNGSQMGQMVMSGLVSLSPNDETGDGDADPNNNPSVDFGLYQPDTFDLALTKTVGMGLVNPGDTVDFTITVHNQGTVAAQTIQVNDYLPPGLLFDAPLNPTWFDFGGGVLWHQEAGPLAPGSQISILLKLVVDQSFGGPMITNYAEINFADDDGDTNNTNPDDLDSDPNADPNDDAIGVDDQLDGDGVDDSDDHDWATITIGPPPTLTLGDLVWNDADNDGVKDLGENGIGGVEVQLFSDADGDKSTTGDQTLIGTTTTNGSGLYQFTGLVGGNYFVKLTGTGIPAGMVSSTGGGPTDDSGAGPSEPAPDPDNNSNTDDNGTQMGAMVMSGVISIAPNSESNDGDADLNSNPSVDFGLYLPVFPPDTLYVSIPVDSVTVPLCPTADDLPSTSGITYTICENDGQLDFGTATVDGPTGCVLYHSGAVPGDFVDTICVVGTDPHGHPDTTVWIISITPTLSVGNFVWNDLDNDGSQDGGEPGIVEVQVQLFSDTDGDKSTTGDQTLVATTFTGAGGFYQFTGLFDGNYFIKLTGLGIQAGMVSSTGGGIYDNDGSGPSEPAADPDINNDTDDDGSQMGLMVMSGVFTLTINGETNDGDGDPNNNPSIDFGLYEPTPLPTLSLGDLVWNDTDNDGVKDVDENGIGGVEVQLFSDADGDKSTTGDQTLVGTTTTNGSGIYGFSGLSAGNYFVKLTGTGIPTGMVSSTGDGPTDNDGSGGYEPAANPDDNVNGIDDGTQMGAMVMSGVFTLTINGETNDGDNDPNNNPSIDFGLYEPTPLPTLSLGDLVWNDTDNDGVKDVDENGIGGVEVQLFSDADGDKSTTGDQTLVGTTTTNGSGIYGFSGLSAGNYFVKLTGTGIPAGMVSSTGDGPTDNDGSGGYEPAADPDDNTNGIDDGTQMGAMVMSGVFTLTINGETNDGDNDPNNNPSIDFGLYVPVTTFDLALVKNLGFGQASTVAPGDDVLYSITIFNQGLVPAHNVAVTDYVPAGMTFDINNNPGGWSFDGNTGQATINIGGPIAPSTSFTVTLVLTVNNDASGSITNTAEISSADNDTDPNNDPPTDVDSGADNTPGDPQGPDNTTDNSGDDEDDSDPATVNVVIPGTFDLALQKLLAPGQPVFVNPGDLATFRIRVINQGEVAAANILVTDYLSAHEVLADPDWTAVSATEANITLPGILAPGDTAEVDITVQVVSSPVHGAQVVNFAEISSATDGDGNPVTDTDSSPDNDPNDDTVGGDIDEVDNKGGDEDDHDYAVLIDFPDFDPIGFIYCDNSGEIIPGGTVTVTPPPGGAIYYVNGLDGSTGIYQFYTNGVPGTYTLTYNHPSGYPLSATCLPQPGAFDPTGQDGVPGVDNDGIVNGFVTLGQDSTGGYLNDYSCGANPYFLQFDLEAGDEEVRHNNIPLACSCLGSIACNDDGNDDIDQNDTPLPGATIYLYDCNGNAPIDSTVTDANGNYLFDNLLPGSYQIYHYYPPGSRPVSGGPIGPNGFSDCIDIDWGECDSSAIVCLYNCPYVKAGFDDYICGGDSALLDGYSVGDLLGPITWSPAADLNDPNSFVTYAHPTITTTYTISYDDGLGCQSSDQEVVNVLCTPYIDDFATTPSLDCTDPNGTIAIYAESQQDCDFEYSIDGVNYQPGNVFYNMQAGTYPIYVRSTDGCTMTDEVTVQGPLPPHVIDAPDEIYLCEEDLAQIAIKIDDFISSVSIVGTAGFLPPVISDSTVTFLASLEGQFDNFTVTITAATGCTVEHTVYLFRSSKPVSDFVVIEPACDNAPVCFKFTGSATEDAILNWNVADGTIVSTSPAGNGQPAGAQICVHFPSPGFRMIMLMVEDLGGCTDLSTEGVNVKKAPLAIAPPDLTICFGDSVLLVGDHAGALRCWWEPQLPLGNYVPNCDTTVKPAVSTNYVLWVCDGNGCKDSDTTRVNVEKVNPDAGFDTEICYNDCAVFTATGAGLGGHYLWSTGGTKASITVCPTVNTTYYVTVTNVRGCSAVDSVKVIVHPLPDAVASPDQSICFGDCTTLTVTGLPVTSTFSYEWSNGSTLASTTVCPTASEDYEVTVYDQNGCEARDTVHVEVNPLPLANAGPDQTICAGNCTNLTATGGTGFLWSTGATTATINVCPAATTDYYVTVTDANGCTGRDTVTVNVLIFNGSTSPDASICEGGCTMLMAFGGVSYHWSNGSNDQMTIVCPPATTTYTVTITNVLGCTDVDTVTVTINLPPVANAGPDTTICEPGCVILSATGGVSYAWIPPTGLQSPSSATTKACVNATTTYTVVVTDANGCIGTDQVTVFVQPFTADAGPNQGICFGNTATLTATGGGTYLWSTGATTASITVSPTATTTYSVTVTSPIGCTDADDVTVTIYPLPVPNLGPDQTICAGQSVTIQAYGGGTYFWSTGATTSWISVAPAATTTYAVTVTSVAGCTAVEDITIYVNSVPIAAAGADITICTGGCASLTASGGDTYLWSTGATTAGINVCPTSTTTYTVTVTSLAGCTAVDAVVVTVSPAPAANAGSDQTICFGKSATLTASGGTNYLWSTGQTTASITVSPTFTTSYTVTVTNALGCTAADLVVVYVVPNPVVSITPGDVAICPGSGIWLQATPGFASYAWSPAAGLSPTNAYQVLANPTTTTTYTVTVTDANGCTGTASVTVTIKPEATVDLGPDQTVCGGDCTTLTAAGNGVGFSWSNGATTPSITVCPTVPTVYAVTVTGPNGCTNSDFVLVNIGATATATAGPNATTCPGGPATITATGGGTYLWSTGATTASITVSPAVTTIYTVTVTNPNGCTATASATVTVNPAPTANAGPDAAICTGNTANLTATGGGSYAWSNGGNTATISVSPLATTTYTVTVTNANGCTATDQVTVTVNGNAVADAGPDQTICAGDFATLVASGGTAYSWSNGVNSNLNIVSPSATTTYTVTVVNAQGCTGTDQVTVTVDNGPTANAGPDVILCGSGSTTTLTATGGGSYQWSTGANTASTTVSPLASTIYSVTVTNANGCTDSDQVAVTVVPKPNVSIIPGDVAICPGSGVWLAATPGFASYAWGPAVGITPTNTDMVLASPTITTTYTVTVTDNNGCTATASATVTIKPGPTADAGADQSICPGACANLTATGGDSYLWSNGAATASTQVCPTAPTIYTVTVTGPNGCTALDNVLVNTNGAITANAGPDQSTCPGQTVTLTASGGTGYLWSTGAVTASINVNPTSTTIYTVTVSNGTGCTGTDAVTVNVSNNLTLNATSNPASCDLSNGSASVTATGGSGNYSYAWSPNVSTGPTASNLPMGSYSVTVTDMANGCTKSVSVLVNSSAAVSATLTATSATCAAENGTINVSFSGGTAPYAVTWSGPEAGSTPAPSSPYLIAGLAPGTYIVTVSDGGGCTNAQTVQVQQGSSQMAVLANNTIKADCNGGTNGQISVIINGGNSPFVISIDNVVKATNVTTNPTTINGYAAGTYTVTAQDANGCTGSVQVQVTEKTPPTLTLAEVDPIEPSCYGMSNGSWWPVSAQVLELYQGNTFLGQLPVSNLPAGVYTVKKTVSGCTASLDIVLEQPDQLQLTATVTSQANCCGLNGAASASASGGTPGYTYFWPGNKTGAVQTGLAAGTYVVTVDDNQACSTTATVTIVPDCSGCQDIILEDSIAATQDDSIEVCLPLTQTALDYYDLLVDGQLYQGSYHGCDYDSIVAYSYAAVTASGPAPYRLISWVIGNTTYTNYDFNTFGQLADSMNVWDPTGNWAHNVGAQSIVGGNFANSANYGPMLWTNTTNWIQSTLNPNYIQVAQGTQIVIPGTIGVHCIDIIDPVTCCKDTICVYVSPQVAPQPNFITLNTPYQTPVGGCVDLVDLDGPLASLAFCNPPDYGTIVFDDNCFTYTPNAGFSGVDQFCLVACGGTVCDTTYVTVNVGPPGCDDIVAETSLNLQAAACDTTASVCVEISNAQILTYSITDNGAAYSGAYGGCDYDTTYNYLTVTIPGGGNSGPYNVSWVINGTAHNGTFANIAGLVAWMNNEDPGGAWAFNPATQAINGGINGTNYGTLSFSNSGGVGQAQVNANYSPAGTELYFSIGQHTVIFSKGNCQDTLTVTVTCPSVDDAVRNFTIGTGEVGTFCLSEVVTNGATVVSVSDACAANNGVVLFNIDQQTGCISFSSPQIGTGQACLFVCLNTGQCFNVTLNVNVVQGATPCQIVTPNTIDVDLGACQAPYGTFCIDLPFLNLADYSVQLDGAAYAGSTSPCSFNGGQNGSGTEFEVTTMGDHVFRFTHTTSGCYDTVNITTACFQLTPTYIKATIYVADQDTVCLDPSQLPGNIFTVANPCPAQNGFVLFENIGGCYLCTGLAVGVETVCFVMCDNLGFCDTTYMEVTVLPRSLTIPIAVDDADTTITNQSIDIPVLLNDTVPGVLTTIVIINQPQHGTVTRNVADNTLTYEPDPGYCDEDSYDQFTYAVCNAIGCDTATVTVTVLCDLIRIYNGFSPDGDGINDVFTIDGLANFPDNELTIFGRWGNRIYQKHHYDNSWDGTWNDGQSLPDGTYFYLFSDGEGRSYSGYVQIQR